MFAIHLDTGTWQDSNSPFLARTAPGAYAKTSIAFPHAFEEDFCYFGLVDNDQYSFFHELQLEAEDWQKCKGFLDQLKKNLGEGRSRLEEKCGAIKIPRISTSRLGTEQEEYGRSVYNIFGLMERMVAGLAEMYQGNVKEEPKTLGMFGAGITEKELSESGYLRVRPLLQYLSVKLEEMAQGCSPLWILDSKGIACEAVQRVQYILGGVKVQAHNFLKKENKDRIGKPEQNSIEEGSFWSSEEQARYHSDMYWGAIASGYARGMWEKNDKSHFGMNERAPPNRLNFLHEGSGLRSYSNTWLHFLGTYAIHRFCVAEAKEVTHLGKAS